MTEQPKSLENCVSEEDLKLRGFHKRGNDYFKRIHNQEIRYVSFIQGMYLFDRIVRYEDRFKSNLVTEGLDKVIQEDLNQ